MSRTAVEPRMTLREAGDSQFEIVEPATCYRLTVPGCDVVFEVDRLAWHRQELSGELMVRCDRLGTDAVDGVLSMATFNLSSARARTERAALLARQSRSGDIPWAPLIEKLCQRVLAAERTGEPAVALRDVVAADAGPLVRVFGFDVPIRHNSIIFGDGGSTKSLLALYLAGLMARAGYRVAFFDWELDALDHRERFATLFGDDLPAHVFYDRCSRPLVYEVDRLRRIVRQQGIDFAFYDSVGFACHTRPEDAESALAYGRACRQIGIGGLHVAHINKSEHGDKQPFGSAFWHNSSRATWFLKATDDATPKVVGVFNRKHNLSKFRQPPFAYEVAVDGARTAFRLTDVATVDELAPALTVLYRLRSVLRAGPMTRDQIVAALDDQKPDTVRRQVNRGIDRGALVRVPGPDGIERIGLPSRHAS